MTYDDGFPDDFEKYYEDMVDARELEDMMRYNIVPDLTAINDEIGRAQELKSELVGVMKDLKEAKAAFQRIVEQIEELEEEIG